MRSTLVVVDNTPLYRYLESEPVAASFDHNWLITLGVGLWDHSQDQADAVIDMVGWLRIRLPEFYNDLICYTAGMLGCSYSCATETMVQQVVDIIENLAELIEVKYWRLLSPFVYNGGWTVTAIRFYADGTLIHYTQTKLNELKTASESLLFRLDQLYRGISAHNGRALEYQPV